MALAWVLRDPRVTSALIGARSVAQLEENVAALDALDFGEDELAEIDRHAVDAGINLWAESSERDDAVRAPSPVPPRPSRRAGTTTTSTVMSRRPPLSFFDTAMNAAPDPARAGWTSTGGEVIGGARSRTGPTARPSRSPTRWRSGCASGTLGRSSVRYELGVLRGRPETVAEGWFVDVFVDRATRRPVQMPPRVRAALSRLAP